MNIVVTHPDPQEALHWVQALQTLLPAAYVRLDLESDREDQAADHSRVPTADRTHCASKAQVFCAAGWKPPADFFARYPGLTTFFCAGAGVDHLLQHPGLPPGLEVVRLEDAGMGPLMADYCEHALLHISGGFARYRQQQELARWQAHEPLPREALDVGIVGLGVLGLQVARRLQRAGFRVRGYTRTPRQIEDIEVLHGAQGWLRFLSQTRVLILLAPRTPETENLIDATALAALPQGAWLINVARGALVVDADLLASLDAGHLNGAILDVFREEPLPAHHAFWHHPRVLITPHVAAPTQVEISARQVAANIGRLIRGEALQGLVDRGRGY